MVLKNRLVFDVWILKSATVILDKREIKFKMQFTLHFQFEPVLWQNEHFDA